MFISSVEVKNFMGLTSNHIEFKSNFNVLWGENGAGKSTFIEIFDFLVLLYSKQITERNIIEQLSENPQPSQSMQFRNDSNLYKAYSTIGNDEPLHVKFSFSQEGKNGMYEVILSSENVILFEELKFNISKKMSSIFKREGDNFKFNKELSIIYKKYNYIFDKKKSVIDSINYLFTYNAVEKENKSLEIINVLSHFVIHNFKFHKNNIHASRKGILEPIFNVKNKDIESFETAMVKPLNEFKEFVKSIDTTITDISFDKTLGEDKTHYFLCTHKMINSKAEKIRFTAESSGTKAYIEFFNMIYQIGNVDNTVFFWDEIDLYMHEGLLDKLIMKIKKNIEMFDRQIFITTHNTTLLNNKELDQKGKFIVSVNKETGRRKFKKLEGQNARENFADKFLKSEYGGNS